MEYSPGAPANASEFTVWENPTKQTVRFRIWIEAQAHKYKKEDWARGVRPVKFKDYEVPPGGSIMLESRYDQAIQKTDKFGVVQSGVAPQLRKRGSPLPQLDPALDPLAGEKRRLRERVEKAQETAVLVKAILKDGAPDAQPVPQEDEELRELREQIAKLDAGEAPSVASSLPDPQPKAQPRRDPPATEVVQPKSKKIPE